MTPPTVQFIPAAGLSLIIHDAFGGSGYLEGRSPDTVDNGSTWVTGGATAWAVQSGYAYMASATYKAMIDQGTTTYRVEYESYTTSNNQHGLGFRYDGPTSTRSTIFLNSNMTKLQSFERVGSINVVTDLATGLSGLVNQSLYWTFDVNGSSITYDLSDGSGSVASGTTTLQNSIGLVGLFHAGTGISVRSQDFKVYA